MTDDRRIEQEDHDLMRRMAARDVNALDAFYDKYRGLAFSLVLRIVGNRADAEDVTMDVFWQVWQQSQKYDSSRGKPAAWLITIARTRAIDCVRRISRQHTKMENVELQNGPAGASSEPEPFVVADIRQAVREALETLADNQKVPLELAYFQGMSHTEIATALGQPLGTVKDRIRTGMAHLRKRLKAYL